MRQPASLLIIGLGTATLAAGSLRNKKAKLHTVV